MTQTDPLQLIKDPIAPASRHSKPAYLAANVHPPNFPKKASKHMKIVNAHIVANKRTSISQSSVIIAEASMLACV